MPLTILAVANSGPAWADAACADYLRRLPRHWKTTVRLLPPTPRGRSGDTADNLRQRDADKLRAALPAGATLLLLDERGAAETSLQWAQRLRRAQDDNQHLCWLIGGPDGVDASLRAQATAVLALSALTLPHALVRVLLLEQLWRAHSILSGHPYHRE